MVAVLRFYVDESGTHDNSPVTTTGIFFAKPSVWVPWTKKWNFRKKPIKLFHAVDCQNLRGEFKGWSEQERDEYVRKLLPVISEFDIKGIVVGVNNEDLANSLKKYPKIGEIIEHPYEACFVFALQELLWKFERLGVHDRVAIIHEDNDYKKMILNAFDWVKKNGLNKDRKINLKFDGKDGAVPLQAADILAYEGNKRIRNIKKPVRRSWRALNPSGRRIGLSHFNEAAFDRWVAKLEGMGVWLR